MDRVTLGMFNGTTFVDGIAGDIKDTTKDAVADGHGDGGAGVDGFATAHEAFGGGHRDGADQAIAEVLLDLEDEASGLALDLVVDLDGVVDLGYLIDGELDVDDGAEYLGDRSFSAHDICISGRVGKNYWAAAPAVSSRISWVIAA